MYIASGIIHVVLKVAHTLVLVLGLGPGLHYTLLTTAQQLPLMAQHMKKYVLRYLFWFACLLVYHILQ